MGSADTFMNLSQGLAGNIRNARNELKSFNDISQTVNKSFDKTNKEMNLMNDVSRTVNDSYDDINESSKNIHSQTLAWSSALNGVRGAAGSILKVFLGGAAALSFGDAIFDAVKLHQSMTDLSYQMGQSGKTAAALETSVYGVQKATGKASEDVERMITGLVKMRVPAEILDKLASDSLNLQTITGGNVERIQDMTGKLVQMGGLGQKSVSNILGSIAQTQRAFGMTSESVDALTTNISETTSVLRNMGKTSVEIERFQKGTIKLAGAFESVGIEAQTATDLINRMLDPGKLEDNALLFAKMGISIEDAMSGNIDPEQMISGFKDIGSELKDLSGPQANALANAMGVPLQQLRQMGNMDMSQIREQFGGMIKDGADLTAMNEEQSTTQRDMEQMWNKIKGTLGSIVSKLMPAFDAIAKLIANNMERLLGFVDKMVSGGGLKNLVEWITNTVKSASKIFANFGPKMLIGIVAVIAGFALLKKKFYSVSTETSKHMRSTFKSISPEIGKSISDGVAGGMEMASEKSAKVFTEKMKMAGRLVADDHQRRIEAGHKYAALNAAEEYQKVLSNQNTFGWAKSINEGAAKYLGTVKNAAKPISLLDGVYGKINDKIKEKSKLATADFDNERNALITMNTQRDTQIKIKEERMKDLLLKENLTTEQEKELAFLKKSKEVLVEQNLVGADRLKNIENKKLEVQTKYLKLLSDDELKAMLDNADVQRDTFKTKEAELQKSVDARKREAKVLELSTAQLNKQQGLLLGKKNLTSDEAAELANIQAGLRSNRDIIDKTNTALAIATDELGKSQRESAEFEKNMVAVEEAAKGISPGADGDRTWKSFFKRAGDAGMASVKLAFSGVSDFATKTTKSFSNVGKAVKDVFTKQGLGAGMRYLAQGTLKAGLGLSKNMLKGGLNLAKGAAKAGASMAKKIGGAAYSAGKRMGDSLKNAAKGAASGAARGMAMAGSALLMGALMKSESGKKMMEKLQGVITNLMDKLGPTFEKLMPIIDQLVAFLMPIVEKVASIIGGLVEKLVPVIMGLMEKAMPIIQKLLSALMPIIQKVIEALAPILEVLMGLVMDLVGAFLPAFMDIFKLIVDLIVPLMVSLVKKLLPPLLTVLGFLLKVSGHLIKAIGTMVIGLSKLFPALKEVGETISGVGDSVIEAGDAMTSAADLMSGAAIKLVKPLDDLTEAFEEIKFDGLKLTMDTMTNMLGLTAEETSNMSTKELAARIKETGQRERMIDALRKNSEILQKQYLKEQAENLAQAIAQETAKAQKAMTGEALKQVYDSKASFDNEGNEFNNGINFSGIKNGRENIADSLMKQSSSVISDFYAELKNNGGEINAELINKFSDIFADSGVGTKTNDIKKMIEDGWGEDILVALDKTISEASIGTTQIDSITDAMISFFGKGSLESEALTEMIKDNPQAINDIIDSTGGNTEKMVAEFSKVLSAKGGVLDQDSWQKVFNSNEDLLRSGIENFKKELGPGANTTELDTALAALDELKKTDTSAEDKNNQIMDMMKGSDGLLASYYKQSGITFKELLKKAEEQADATKSSKSDGETIVTKMYPAILDATSSSWVKSEDARIEVTGMSKEEAEQYKQTELLRESNELLREQNSLAIRRVIVEEELAKRGIVLDELGRVL